MNAFVQGASRFMHVALLQLQSVTVTMEFPFNTQRRTAPTATSAPDNTNKTEQTRIQKRPTRQVSDAHAIYLKTSPRDAMNATPRLKSGFPATPASGENRRQLETPSSIQSTSSRGSTNRSPTLPLAPENVRADVGARPPVIPLAVLDAPKQRLYAFAVYTLLFAWKMHDWLGVAEEGEGSWSSFTKWIVIDFLFIFFLPEFRIPWLELSQTTVMVTFAGHALFDWFLMFLIPVSCNNSYFL